MDSKEPVPGASHLGELNTNEIPTGIDREKLEQIDAQVTDRLVIGKLSYLKEPVVIHGVQFLPANFQGGPDWLTVTEAGLHYDENSIPRRSCQNVLLKALL